MSTLETALFVTLMFGTSCGAALTPSSTPRSAKLATIAATIALVGIGIEYFLLLTFTDISLLTVLVMAALFTTTAYAARSFITRRITGVRS